MIYEVPSDGAKTLHDRQKLFLPDREAGSMANGLSLTFGREAGLMVVMPTDYAPTLKPLQPELIWAAPFTSTSTNQTRRPRWAPHHLTWGIQ